MPVCVDVTKNVFYWTRVATVVAQGSGMHRRYSATKSHQRLLLMCAQCRRLAAQSTRQAIVETYLVDLVYPGQISGRCFRPPSAHQYRRLRCRDGLSRRFYRGRRRPACQVSTKQYTRSILSSIRSTMRDHGAGTLSTIFCSVQISATECH